MTDSGLSREIIRELGQLPPELQRRVLHFVRVLAQSVRKGVPGKELLRFAGVVESEDVEAMRQATQAGCGRVDADDW